MHTEEGGLVVGKHFREIRKKARVNSRDAASYLGLKWIDFKKFEKGMHFLTMDQIVIANNLIEQWQNK